MGPPVGIEMSNPRCAGALAQYARWICWLTRPAMFNGTSRSTTTAYSGWCRAVHARPNTAEEHRRLLKNAARSRCREACRSNFKAGDGIVYSHFILHWGSNYSAKLRRTIHLGYRALRRSRFSRSSTHTGWEARFHDAFSARGYATRFQDFYSTAPRTGRCDGIYPSRHPEAGIGRLSWRDLKRCIRGTEGRTVCVVLLSKWVDKLRTR